MGDEMTDANSDFKRYLNSLPKFYFISITDTTVGIRCNTLAIVTQTSHLNVAFYKTRSFPPSSFYDMKNFGETYAIIASKFILALMSTTIMCYERVLLQ